MISRKRVDVGEKMQWTLSSVGSLIRIFRGKEKRRDELVLLIIIKSNCLEGPQGTSCT